MIVLRVSVNGNTRRYFLKSVLVGAALAALPGCLSLKNAFFVVDDPTGAYDFNRYAEVIRERRAQKHDYSLPLEKDVSRKNLVDLVLGLEQEFTRGSVSEKRYADAKKGYAALLERFSKRVDRQYIDRLLDEEKISLESGSDKKARFVAADMATTVLARLDRSIRNKNGFSEPAEYSSAEDGDVESLADVFTKKRFNCEAYSLLALGVAEKYNMPLHAVHVPGHMYTRWRSRLVVKNFDQGEFTDDSSYFSGSYSNFRKRIHPVSVDRGAYFHDLSKTELVGHYMSNIAKRLVKGNEVKAAMDLLSVAQAWAPKDPSVHDAYGMVLAMMGYVDDALLHFSIAHSLDSNYRMTRDTAKVRKYLVDNGISVRRSA